jgi:hypothetical protein
VQPSLVLVRCADACCECRWYRGKEKKRLLEKANNMRMPACVELEKQGYEIGGNRW